MLNYPWHIICMIQFRVSQKVITTSRHCLPSYTNNSENNLQ